MAHSEPIWRPRPPDLLVAVTIKCSSGCTSFSLESTASLPTPLGPQMITTDGAAAGTCTQVCVHRERVLQRERLRGQRGQRRHSCAAFLFLDTSPLHAHPPILGLPGETYRGKFAQLADARLYLLQNTIDSRFHHGCLLDASGADKTGHEQWRARARRWPIQCWLSNVAESLDHGPAHDPSHPPRLNLCKKWHLCLPTNLRFGDRAYLKPGACIHGFRHPGWRSGGWLNEYRWDGFKFSTSYGVTNSSK